MKKVSGSAREGSRICGVLLFAKGRGKTWRMLEPRGGRFVTVVLTEVVLGARSVVYMEYGALCGGR